MRWLFNRKLVTPLLMALGLLVMLGGEVDSGAIFYAVAIGYWLVANVAATPGVARRPLRK